jgi:hypothetical protein
MGIFIIQSFLKFDFCVQRQTDRTRQQALLPFGHVMRDIE